MVIRTKRIPILAAGLKDSNSDTNLNADRLSETEVHLPILKEEFSRYFLEKVNNLFPLVNPLKPSGNYMNQLL
jgi:hypothetical protein